MEAAKTPRIAQQRLKMRREYIANHSTAAKARQAFADDLVNNGAVPRNLAETIAGEAFPTCPECGSCETIALHNDGSATCGDCWMGRRKPGRIRHEMLTTPDGTPYASRTHIDY